MAHERKPTRESMVDMLHQSRGTFQKILDSMTDFLFLVDAEGALRLVNRPVLERLAYSEDELLGTHCLRLHPQDCRAEVEKLLLDVLEGRASQCDIPFKAKDGTLIPVQTKLSQVRLNEARYVLGISRDVRDQQQAIEALERERDLVRAIFDSSPIAITLTSLEGVIKDCNSTAWKGGGFASKDELIGRNSLDLVAEKHHAQAIEQFMKTYQSGVVNNLLYDLVDKDGRQYPSETSAAVVRGNQGEPVGFVAMSQNITERKRLEGDLHQSQRMESIGRLAGGVAHDFNNILTAIRGYANFALDSLDKDHMARDDVEEILHASERAETLTRQLLAFSRRQILRAQAMSLGSTILDMSKMLRRIIPMDVELVILPAEDLWTIEADAGQIEQVIVNLVVRARDAMKKGGKLIIEANNVHVAQISEGDPTNLTPGDYVLMTISDDGPALSEEDRQRIFDPFFDSDPEKATASQGEGADLGLATVYGIITQHAGFISVDAGTSQGTAFKIYLPRTESQVIPSAFVEHLPGGNETVLVVEDEPLVKEITVRNLASLGYKVLEADNGEEALRLSGLHKGVIHLLVTDVVMPRMGGKELNNRIKVERPDLRTLFVSGYTDDTILRLGIQSGAIAFLEKPFSLRKLAKAVRDALEANPAS